MIDHHCAEPEIGTRADYEVFLAELKRNGLAHILDIVPNHVGVGTNNNAWWNDVLENGPALRYAKYFDIRGTAAAFRNFMRRRRPERSG